MATIPAPSHWDNPRTWSLSAASTLPTIASWFFIFLEELPNFQDAPKQSYASLQNHAQISLQGILKIFSYTGHYILGVSSSALWTKHYCTADAVQGYMISCMLNADSCTFSLLSRQLIVILDLYIQLLQTCSKEPRGNSVNFTDLLSTEKDPCSPD